MTKPPRTRDGENLLSRRRLLAGAAAGAAAAATIAAPAIAQGNRELKMVTAWPPNFPGLGSAASRVAQRISDMTDGQLTVRVYAAGELVGALETFDAVSTGAADMYHAADYYFQGKNPGFNFFTSVPFGLNANEFNAWIYHGGGQALWDELSGQFGIKAMPCANSGVQMGGWFNKEIISLEDFKGLKMRMPGLGGEVLRRLGANVMTLAGSDIFPALQNGTIDATEWVGPWNDLAFGFYRAAKFYYWPGFHEPGACLSLGLNRGVWDSLSNRERAIISSAAQAEDSYTLAEFNAQNANALRALVNEHGVQLRKMPDDVMREIGRLSGEVVREAGQADDLTRRIYESYMNFRTSVMSYMEISEEGYFTARRLGFPY